MYRAIASLKAATFAHERFAHASIPSPRVLALALGLAASGLVYGGTACAATSAFDPETVVARADFVFEGVVERVEYAFSDAQGGARPHLPHTFVTYHIERIIRGHASGDTLTLRFIGGRGERSQFLMVLELPLFDVGDRDVLLVSGNTESGCPLVGCKTGRLREIGGGIFTEDGQSVELDTDGGLELGAHYDLPEVMTHHVSQTEIRRHDHFEQGESRQTFVAGSGTALTADDLVMRLRAATVTLPGRDVLVRSADIAQPFELRPIVPMARPAEPARPAPREQGRTAQERAELEAVARADSSVDR